MNKYEIVKKIEAFAPLDTQESWDSSGWIVDNENVEVNKILFALTITKKVIQQAVKQGCDMIISHHPLFTVPLEYRKINMYCAHTNLDKAFGGTTDLLLDTIHLSGIAYNEFVRVVELEQEMSVEFLKLKLLPISPRLRVVNNNNVKTVKKIGFCAGSGSEFIETTPCDAFVTGDIKFHKAVESDKVLYDIGHFESEIMVVRFLRELTELGDSSGGKGILANETSPFI